MASPSITRMPRRAQEARAATSRAPATRSSCSQPTGPSRLITTLRYKPQHSRRSRQHQHHTARHHNSHKPSRAPQQPGQQSQPQEPQNSQQDGQRQQQCQQAADFYQITDMVWKTSGSAGSLAGGRPMPGRNGPGAGQCNCAPQQAGPQKQSPDDSNQNCTPAGFTETSPQDGTLVIDQTRWANAIKILTQGRAMDRSEQEQRIALMTSLREAQLINTGNSNTNPLDTPLGGSMPGSAGHGPGLTPADRELSFRMADTDPNFFNTMPYTDYLGRSVVIDVSGDNDSVGLFQQRVPIYGSPSVAMDPWISSRMFFERLRDVIQANPGMSDPDLAQAVQHSAPASYKNWQDAANDLFDKVQGCPAIGRQE